MELEIANCHRLYAALALCCSLFYPSIATSQELRIEVGEEQTLALPTLSIGTPAAGKMVAVTPPEYAGTDVFHTVYLPHNWKPNGAPIPIIFEYTGNYFPTSGSTGRVEHAALGFGVSGGKYIWVSLPYIDKSRTRNEVTWWGDEQATVAYAKRNVPRVVKKFNADPGAVFLCGFSRGAIAVNYIGLHDDAIAGLWTAFITHDHFDGAREWKTDWGAPLDTYQERARERLQRVGDRPYWVSQNGSNRASEEFVRSSTVNIDNFTFEYLDLPKILGPFPNATAKSSHTDRWPLVPSEYRRRIRKWMNAVAYS